MEFVTLRPLPTWRQRIWWHIWTFAQLGDFTKWI